MNPVVNYPVVNLSCATCGDPVTYDDSRHSYTHVHEPSDRHDIQHVALETYVLANADWRPPRLGEGGAG